MKSKYVPVYRGIALALGIALLLAACAPAAQPAALPVPQPSRTFTSAAASATRTLTPEAVQTAVPTSAPTSEPTAAPAAEPTSAVPAAIPELSVETVLDGLSNPWDIVWLGDGSFIFSERGNKLTYVANGELYPLNAPDDTYVRGEGGMLGLAIDPEFTYHPYLYACLNSTAGGKADVRVARWEFAIAEKRLINRVDIITGMPSNTSGRHSGCQLAFGPDGYLWVGTGDTAVGTIPQDPQSLGGKVLRVDRDGNPAPGNLGAPFDPRIYSYGHRNIQGLAFFDTARWDGTALGISVEHGTSRDDEVNALLPGNYGWDPVPGYNEARPMTDLARYPDAHTALWSSGDPTLATSGAVVLSGPQWGAWDQAVAVAAQKASRLIILELNPDMSLRRETHLFTGEFGRLRTAQQGPDGSLYLLTDNGSGRDRILRVTAGLPGVG